MAEEEQKILIEVDYSSVEEYAKAAAEAKKKLDAFKASNKELKESGEATAEQIEASNAAVRQAQKDYKNATNTLDKMTTANKALATSYDGAYQQWQAAERKLKAMEGTIRQNADGTFELTEEYKAAAKEVAALKDVVNKFTTETKDGRNNVGLYGDAIKESFGGLSGQLQSAIPGFDKLSQGINVAKTGFTSLKGAIMATGIGTLVLLLTSLFQYLTKTKEGATALSQATSALGAAFDVLMAVLKPLGKWMVSIFTEPKKALKELGDFLISQVVNRFKALGDILKGVMQVIKGDLSGGLKTIGEGALQAATGVENLGGKLKAITASAIAAAKAAAALAKAQSDLDQANVNATYSLADLQKKAENYKQISDDATRSMEERQKAAAAADATERQMMAKRVQLAAEALRIANLELAAQKKTGNDTIEVQKKAAEAYAALREAQTAYRTALNDNGKRAREIALDTLELQLDALEKGFDAVKAFNVSVIGDDRKTVAERQIILESLTTARNAALANEINLIEKQSGKQIDLANLVADKDAEVIEKKIRAIGLAEKAQIRLQDIVKNQIDTTTEFSDLQKALDEKALARKVSFTGKEKELRDSANAKINEMLISESKAALELSAKTETNKATIQIKNAEERALKIQQIETAKAQALRDMELKNANDAALLAEQQRNDKAIADINAMQLENEQKAALQAENEALNQQNLLAISQQYDQQKKDNAAQTEAEITANQMAEIKMREMAMQGTLDVASNVFGTMAELMGKQTKLGKAFAITQALINTYSSATAAYNSAASIPVVGWVLGPIAAAAAVAMGLKNVAAIKSANVGGGGGGAASSGTGQTLSSTFTAASPKVATSQAAASQSGTVGVAQQGDAQAAKAGNATAQALQNNPPVLYVDTFEAKQNEKNAVSVKANV